MKPNFIVTGQIGAGKTSVINLLLTESSELQEASIDHARVQESDVIRIDDYTDHSPTLYTGYDGWQQALAQLDRQPSFLFEAAWFPKELINRCYARSGLLDGTPIVMIEVIASNIDRRAALRARRLPGHEIQFYMNAPSAVTALGNSRWWPLIKYYQVFNDHNQTAAARRTLKQILIDNREEANE